LRFTRPTDGRFASCARCNDCISTFVVAGAAAAAAAAAALLGGEIKDERRTSRLGAPLDARSDDAKRRASSRRKQASARNAAFRLLLHV